MRATSRFVSSMGILLAAFVFLTVVPSNLGPVKMSGLFGVDTAHAQRAGRRNRNESTGQGDVSARVADAYNEALELIQADSIAGGIALLTPMVDGASPFEKSILYRLLGQAEIARDDFNRAGGYFQQAIDSGGLEGNDLAGLYLILGQIYMVDGQYNRAITTLEQYFVIAEEPEAQAYYILAQVYAVAERHREAIRPARTAIDLSPEPRENFLRLLMSLYLTLDEWNNAIPLLQQLVALVPTKDEYWTSLAGVYSQVGRDREAFAVYQFRYLMGFLETSRELVTLSELYMYHNVPYKAATILNRELTAGRIEASGDNWEKLGNAWFSAREFRESRAALTRAANLSPNGQIYYRIAGTYIQEENWSQARRFLQRAINRGGLDDVGQAWLLLGHARNATNDITGAREAFERSTNYTDWREDSERWLVVLDNREAANLAARENTEAYEAEAQDIVERGEIGAQLAEVAFGLAQEAFEQARLATQVSASERVSIIETATATLEEAREADDAARNPEFGSSADVREAVRRIGSEARQEGRSEFANALDEESERILERRTIALTESDRLIREAEDQLFEAQRL